MKRYPTSSPPSSVTNFPAAAADPAWKLWLVSANQPLLQREYKVRKKERIVESDLRSFAAVPTELGAGIGACALNRCIGQNRQIERYPSRLAAVAGLGSNQRGGPS